MQNESQLQRRLGLILFVLRLKDSGVFALFNVFWSEGLGGVRA